MFILTFKRSRSKYFEKGLALAEKLGGTWDGAVSGSQKCNTSYLETDNMRRTKDSGIISAGSGIAFQRIEYYSCTNSGKTGHPVTYSSEQSGNIQILFSVSGYYWYIG